MRGQRQLVFFFSGIALLSSRIVLIWPFALLHFNIHQRSLQYTRDHTLSPPLLFLVAYITDLLMTIY